MVIAWTSVNISRKIHIWLWHESFFQDDAQLKYIDLINGLVSEEEESAPASSEPGKYTTLQITNENGLYKIQLNRPKKKNAITIDVNF